MGFWQSEVFCALAGLGSTNSAPSGSISLSVDTLSPDDLDKLTKVVMPQLKQSSYARLQNDYGDALNGLDPSGSTGGPQSGSGARGDAEKADKKGSPSKEGPVDGKGAKGGKGNKGRKGKPDAKGGRSDDAPPPKGDQPYDAAKRDRDGQVKVGSKANKLVWLGEYEFKFGANSRVFKYSDCQQILVDQFGFNWQEARNMCIPCGVDYEPGCASCPCPTKRGHESATSWCHKFPPNYTKTVRKATEG